jgi:hypothetical protein
MPEGEALRREGGFTHTNRRKWRNKETQGWYEEIAAERWKKESAFEEVKRWCRFM